MNEKKYTELADKSMTRLTDLLEKSGVDTRDFEKMDQFGDFVCDVVSEAMRATRAPYPYEVGEMTEAVINISDDTAPRHFYWNMRAGFMNQEEAETYKESLSGPARISLFINGVPVD